VGEEVNAGDQHRRSLAGDASSEGEGAGARSRAALVGSQSASLLDETDMDVVFASPTV
jgi:hypothetical protein